MQNFSKTFQNSLQNISLGTLYEIGCKITHTMASTSAVSTSDGTIEYVEKKNDSTTPKIRINFNNEGKSVVVPVSPLVTVTELVDLIKAKFERLHGAKIQVNTLNNI